MTQHILFAIVGAWLAWALLCWYSPHLIARNLRAPVLCTIPPKLAHVLAYHGIAVFESDHLGAFEGYAFSAWLYTRRAIILNSTFWRFAGPKAKDFLLAHEIGHHVMGHVTSRLLANIFLVAHLPPVRRRLQLTEHLADQFAEDVTGYTAAVLWGPVVVSEAGGSGRIEERKA